MTNDLDFSPASATSPATSRTWMVRIRGELACFTSHDLRVERVSYPIISPPAARGVLEAVFWKHGVSWLIRRIYLMAPVRYIAIRRNEVKNKFSLRTFVSELKRGKPLSFLSISDSRTQRMTLALRDVDYVVEAAMRLDGRHGALKDFSARFEQRLREGRCYHAPYLGCREFAAVVEPCKGPIQPVSVSMEIGPMLRGRAYDDAGRRAFFDAKIENGVLEVPESEVI